MITGSEIFVLKSLLCRFNFIIGMRYFIQIFMLTILSIAIAEANPVPPGQAGFGSPCAGTNIDPEASLVLQENAYGYIQKFIDMTANVPYKTLDGISGKCNDSLPKLDLCFYNDANNPPCDFWTLKPGDSYPIKTISKNPTLRDDASLQNIYLKANLLDKNNLCLTMETPYGQSPLFCKQVDNAPPPTEPQSTCASANKACIGINYSQSIFNFTGSSIECVSSTLKSIFFTINQCPSNPESFLTSIKAFAQFQKALQQGVGALLILYVMFFGFKVILNQDSFSLEMVVKFVIKFVLVLYFSVGIGSYFNSQGQKQMHNGVVEWGLPLATQAMNDFAQMTLQAAGARSLCSFDPASYPPGAQGYSLWDIVDCRIGAYLGVKSVYNLGGILTNRNFREINNPQYGNNIPISMGPHKLNVHSSSPEFGFIYIFFLLLIGGNWLTIISIATFLTIFFSILVGFISMYVICLITLYVFAYISPIFIPLALFEKTSQYYDSWLKAVIGSILQPMIFAGFVGLMITMYDDILFGPPLSAYNSTPGCNFVMHQYQYSGVTDGLPYSQNYNTYEMVLPSADVTGCTRNIGYQMIAYVLGEGSSSLNLLIFSLPQIKDTQHTASSALLLMVFCIIFYYFYSILYDFTSDIVGGINLKGVVLDVVGSAVNSLQNVGKAVLNAAMKVGKGAASLGKKDSKDKKGDDPEEGGKGDDDKDKEGDDSKDQDGDNAGDDDSKKSSDA